MNSKSDNDDAGAPMPDFRASNIQLQTIAPALGVPSIQTSAGGLRHNNRPDYLEYDINPHGRGFIVTMFANSGLSYMIGIGAGGVYGVRHGFRVTPSQRFRVQLNSILNHTGRYGSRAGNAFGTVAMLYSFYEWGFDRLDIEERMGMHQYTNSSIASFISPALSAAATCATYYSPSGNIRVTSLAGSIGFAAVAITYTTYSLLGIPYGSGGFLFF